MQQQPLHTGQLVMLDIEGTAAEVRKLTADLREVMGPLALIGLDQEGGPVIRATFLPQAPAAMALGACGDLERAQHVVGVVSRGLALHRLHGWRGQCVYLQQ